MPKRATQHDARGRGVSKVAEIPRAGWKDIFWRTYNEVIGDHVMLIAAGVTFYALLAPYTRSPDAVAHELEAQEAKTPSVGGHA